MLRNNNSYINYMRFTSGRESSMAGKSSRNNISLCNTMLFGSKVSFPMGYNSEMAICMPLVSGAKMAVIIRGDGYIQTNGITREEGISTMQGVGNVIANMSTAEAMISILSGSGTFQSSAIVIEMLSATLDAGARPSAFDIAQEVWQSNASNYNASGSMGNKVNSASAAGDPWSTELPASYTNNQAGGIISALLKIAKFLQVK